MREPKPQTIVCLARDRDKLFAVRIRQIFIRYSIDRAHYVV
jgi:hypothetical protein